MKKYGKKAVFARIAVCAFIIIGLAAGVYYLINRSGRISDEPVQVYYVYNNPCESCHEYLQFLKKFQSQVSDEVPSSAYHVQELYLLRDSSKHIYDKLMIKLDIPMKDRTAPMLIIGKHYLTGEKNIEKNMKEVLLKEYKGIKSVSAVSEEKAENAKSDVKTQKIPGVSLNKNDSYILYFSTSACNSCEKAAALVKSLPETFSVDKDGKKVTSKLVVEEKNITEAGNLALYQQLLSKYNIPEDKRVVPMIFYQNGYLSGEKEILSGLREVLTAGKAMNFTGSITAASDKAQGLSLKDIPKMFAAGLAGGLNPCSFSMLFLLLSIIAAKKDSVLKLGIIYLTSKLIAYSVIAVFFYHIFDMLESSLLTSFQQIIRMILVIAAFVLAVISFIDFINARNERYGKILLKLPKKIRKADTNIIEKLTSDGKKPLWVTVFILGFIISAGEFLCTGQVYLATLLTMNYMDSDKGVFSYLMLLIFIIAMILPSLCIVILVYRGKRLFIISDYIVRRTDVIKLIHVLVFFIIGIILLIY